MFFLLFLFIVFVYQHIPPKLVDGPRVDIEECFFINMDKSSERREGFLKQFPFKATRVPGVIVDKPRGRLGKGAEGCLLAHKNALEAVARSKGWHLICEDDARGPFAEIASNKYVRHLALSKQFINLSKTKKRPSYSFTNPYDCSFAYLITPIGARMALEKIRVANFSNAIDAIFKEEFETPFFWGGNGLGALVGIIWQDGESEIDKIGR
jgi:hypothetical protein